MFENENYLTRISKSNQISEELVKAMDLIARTRDNELAFDKTIVAEIVKLNDAELGEYYVKYQHGMFKAYVLDENIVYSEGDTVYIKIPQGDFSSNKKIIEGKSKVSSLSEADYDYLANQIIEMNIAYKDEDNIYSLNVGEEETEIIIYENKDNPNSNDFVNLFNSYPRIKISGDFKTNFPNKENPFGEFGLKVDFYYKNPSSKNSISFDFVPKRLSNIHNFIGNLNEYLVFSPQYALYDFQDMNVVLTGIKKISLYAKNYNKDIDFSVNNAYNINVQNIKISFMDKLDEIDSLYYTGIRAEGGTILKTDMDSLSLEGLFYYSGKDLISDTAKCKCFWYKRNPEITESHKKYDKKAGPGWEKVENNVLERLENGEITASQARTYLDQSDPKTYALYGSRLNVLEAASRELRKAKESLNKGDSDYNRKIITLNEEYQEKKDSLPVEFKPAIENNILYVRGMDVYQELDYKFVVVYGQDKEFSKTITISKNSMSRFSLIKTMTEEGKSILKLYDTRKVINENVTVANWYVELPTGEYFSCEKESDFMQIGPYEIYPEATFYANIILSNTWYVPVKYKIKNYLTTDDVKIQFSGNDTFIYDKNYECASSGELHKIKVNIITNYSKIINFNNINWYLVDNEGNTVSILSQDTWKVPEDKNSMIYSLSVGQDNTTVLIKIREHFDSSRTQNLLKIEIVDNDGQIYEFTKMLNFIKQGAHEINPGAYEMTLQYFDNEGQETGEQFLYANSISVTNWSTIYVKPKIVTSTGKIVEHGARCLDVVVNGETEETDNNMYYYDVEITKQQINVQCKEEDGGLYSITKTRSFVTDHESSDENELDYQIYEQYFVRFCASIKILNGKNEVVNRTIINKYFPIALVIGDLDVSKFSNINIPRYVKYDAYGENPSYDQEAISFTYEETVYNKIDNIISSNENLIVTQGEKTSAVYLSPINKFTGSSFPIYSDIELNYSAMGVQRQKLIPMGALTFKIGTRINEMLVWPIVMTIEGEQTKEIVGYQGNGIILNTGDDSTSVAPTVATGSVNWENGGSGEFGGVVIGSETSSTSPVSGVYLYDQTTYSESNVLRTDGSFTLGAGAITCKVKNDNGNEKIKEYIFEKEFILELARKINELQDQI